MLLVSSEQTTEVFVFDIGKKAIGPKFEKTWIAELFSNFSCSKIVVYAKFL